VSSLDTNKLRNMFMASLIKNKKTRMTTVMEAICQDRSRRKNLININNGKVRLNVIAKPTRTSCVSFVVSCSRLWLIKFKKGQRQMSSTRKKLFKKLLTRFVFGSTIIVFLDSILEIFLGSVLISALLFIRSLSGYCELRDL